MRFLKTFLLCVFAVASCCGTSAYADSVDSKIGIGIGVGDNDGASILYRFEKENALQGFISKGDVHDHLAVDYLHLYTDSFDSGVVVPYFGIGGFYANTRGEKTVLEAGDIVIKQGHNVEEVGVRLPVGLHLNVPKTPVQLAVEIAPTFKIEPSTETYLDSMLGVRVMF